MAEEGTMSRSRRWKMGEKGGGGRRATEKEKPQLRQSNARVSAWGGERRRGGPVQLKGGAAVDGWLDGLGEETAAEDDVHGLVWIRGIHEWN